MSTFSRFARHRHSCRAAAPAPRVATGAWVQSSVAKRARADLSLAEALEVVTRCTRSATAPASAISRARSGRRRRSPGGS